MLFQFAAMSQEMEQETLVMLQSEGEMQPGVTMKPVVVLPLQVTG